MTRDDLLAIAQEPRVAAFLHVIRFCEGTLGDRGYSTIFGYKQFASFADHPRVRVPYGGTYTTAAGAYQFIESTWDEMAAKYALPDFSPASQNAAAVGLLIRRKALDAIRVGDLDRAVDATNEEWASLPGAPYGQPTRTMAEVRREWEKALGTAAPIDNRSVPAQPQEAPVAAPLAIPLVGALIGQLIPLIPELARVFTDKTTPVNERNVGAGIKVLEAVQRATNSTGPAVAVERATTTPELLPAVRESVLPLIELVEVGGGIAAAREHNAKILMGPGWQALGYGLLLFIIAVGVVIGGGYVMSLELSRVGAKPETVATVLDYYKAAGFIVLGYLFGTSRSSQRKDDLIITQMKDR